jgi:hypothetical protein
MQPTPRLRWPLPQTPSPASPKTKLFRARPTPPTPKWPSACTSSSDESVRWGDYFDIELDPLDGSFWMTGMYMKLGGQLGELWGTWIRNAGAN